MGFKEIHYFIKKQYPELSNEDLQLRNRFFAKLKGKPFWIWDEKQLRAQDIKTKGDCCFNHIIGLPVKGTGKTVIPIPKDHM